MFRNGSSASTSPYNLRRRYQTVREQQRQNDFQPYGRDTDADGSSYLELSMHLPVEPFGNRFETLVTHSHPRMRSQNDFDVPPLRRIRHGRGSKEAKRRRDARRNKRKLEAIQTLNEQLSAELDRTLDQKSMERQAPWYSPDSFSDSRTRVLPPSRPIQAPPTPPELPYLNFAGLDLMDELPELPPRKPAPHPPRPPVLQPQVPSWCPTLPAFSGNNVIFGDYPLFFDLSSLPEPASPSTQKPHERQLQLWQPRGSGEPRKMSRFFPPSASSKPNVKLPPTGCRLHSVDRGVGTTSPPVFPTVSDSEKQTQMAAQTRDLLTEVSDAYAANLWRILSPPQPETRSQQPDPYLENFFYRPVHDMLAAPYGEFNHQLDYIGTPVELDGKENPFVHINSLTGHSNARAQYPVRSSDEETVIYKSPRSMTPTPEAGPGPSLNELVVDSYSDDETYTDAVLAALDSLLPPSASPAPETTLPVLFAGVPVTFSNEDDDQDDQNASDVHFQSEQSLFRNPSPVPKAAEEDLIDVTTFLSMGHSDNCWCRECEEAEEPPELINTQATATADEYEDWTAHDSYSVASSPDEMSAWESEWGTYIPSEDQDGEEDWVDEEWECNWDWRPSSVAHGRW